MIYVQIKDNNQIDKFIQDYTTHPLTKDRTTEDLKKYGYFTEFPKLPSLGEGEIAYMYYYPETDTFEFEIKEEEK